MTAVSSAPTQPVLLHECSGEGHKNDSFFSLKSSWNSPLKHSLIIEEQFACTRTHTCKQKPLVGGGGGIEGSDFHSFPSRKVWGESGDQHHHHLQLVLLAAMLKPVSIIWHCLEKHKRPSVWKVQERKGRACGLLLQSKDWHRGWEVLRLRLIPSPLKLTGKLPLTPSSLGSCLKCTEGNKTA